MKQEGICLNCNVNFKYDDHQKIGKYCSNFCQGEYATKKKFCIGTILTGQAKKYVNKILGDFCRECGQGREWNKKILTLQIDHINGNIKDNNISNLRLLCPNCHSQTENWGSKNISEEGRKRLATNIGGKLRKKDINLN